MKYKLTLSYDGSKFYGFQRQKDVFSVQKYLEDNISNYLNENIVIKGSGRTDRGVHAVNQVVHFETDKSIKGLKRYLNNKMDYCKIKEIRKVNDLFHARHSVISKTYLYKIDLSKKKDSRYYLHINYKLNIKLMRESAKLLIGDHNYKNFVSGERENYNSTIHSIKIYKIFNVLYFKFNGAGFYRYMVRNLVGALLDVGRCKVSIDVLKEMINNPDKEKRLTTVSPNGLYLIKIRY